MDQEEDTPQEEAPAQKEATAQRTPDKGKKPLNQSLQSADQIPSSSKMTALPNVRPIMKEVKPLPQNKDPKDKESKEVSVDRPSSAFSLQKELEKVKILVPLTELLKQPTYQSQVTSFMLPPEVIHIPDTLNLQEERPMVVFGPHVE